MENNNTFVKRQDFIDADPKLKKRRGDTATVIFTYLYNLHIYSGKPPHSSNRAIAKATRLGFESVRNAIKWLEDNNYILRGFKSKTGTNLRDFIILETKTTILNRIIAREINKSINTILALWYPTHPAMVSKLFTMVLSTIAYGIKDHSTMVLKTTNNKDNNKYNNKGEDEPEINLEPTEINENTPLNNFDKKENEIFMDETNDIRRQAEIKAYRDEKARQIFNERFKGEKITYAELFLIKRAEWHENNSTMTVSVWQHIVETEFLSKYRPKNTSLSGFPTNSHKGHYKNVDCTHRYVRNSEKTQPEIESIKENAKVSIESKYRAYWVKINELMGKPKGIPYAGKFKEMYEQGKLEPKVIEILKEHFDISDYRGG